MLLAAELIHVMNCSPYIRGESIRLIGWHRLWVSVCTCFYLRLCLTTELGRVVYAMVSKYLWVGGRWHELSLTFSLLPSMFTTFIRGVKTAGRTHFRIAHARFLYTVWASATDKSVSHVALRERGKKKNNLVQLFLWEWKLVLKLLK